MDKVERFAKTLQILNGLLLPVAVLSVLLVIWSFEIRIMLMLQDPKDRDREYSNCHYDNTVEYMYCFYSGGFKEETK